MAVELFVDGLEPEEPGAVIWRFMEFWKLKDLVARSAIYFCRADQLSDEHERLPPAEYERVLGLNPYDLRDVQERNNNIGAIAQFRQAFYLNCWYLFDHETMGMWTQYGRDGVAIVSTYGRLKRVLEPIADRPHLGLVRYGSAHLAGWNTIRFITTKHERFKHEREVRALLWLLNSGDGVNRHIGSDGRLHDRPLSGPPDALPEGIRREIDLHTLIYEIVVNPTASDSTRGEIESLAKMLNPNIPVRPSALTRYAAFLPTEEELRRYA